ncbi:hypothetical protein T01_12914 [Trichinella spiralis]|uniref:Uncharacterized protein n=1 Tax=Trichinella spiralis TaxID=6334 RepID=A0A0V1BEL4_TRISP|nr:hypothetical protein T01_12914 [Trichinella spiralis]
MIGSLFSWSPFAYIADILLTVIISSSSHCRHLLACLSFKAVHASSSGSSLSAARKFLSSCVNRKPGAHHTGPFADTALQPDNEHPPLLNQHAQLCRPDAALDSQWIRVSCVDYGAGLDEE